MAPTLAFLDSFSLLGTLGPLLWLVQLALVVHVYRTGRPYWWILVLFFLPSGIGALAYVLVELAPEWRTPTRGGPPGWRPRPMRIAALRRDLEERDIVTVRLALAEELLAAGEIHEARTVAQETLSGAFRDDPHTLATVARYLIEDGHPSDALPMLDRVNTRADRMLATEVTLLRGRTLLELGQHPEAQALLRSLHGTYSSEEPRFYLGLSLLRSGQPDEARKLFDDIRRTYRRGNPSWRRAERPWFRRATQELKALKG